MAGALQPYWAAFSSRATIIKACNPVRGSAVKHVKAALPALGALVQKYQR